MAFGLVQEVEWGCVVLKGSLVLVSKQILNGY